MTVSRFHLTAVLQEVEDGWFQATIAELPGVVTAGRTREEAKSLLHDALREYILAMSPAQSSVEQPGADASQRDTLEIAVSS